MVHSSEASQFIFPTLNTSSHPFVASFSEKESQLCLLASEDDKWEKKGKMEFGTAYRASKMIHSIKRLSWAMELRHSSTNWIN